MLGPAGAEESLLADLLASLGGAHLLGARHAGSLTPARAGSTQQSDKIWYGHPVDKMTI
jgi:hypothetical protein